MLARLPALALAAALAASAQITIRGVVRDAADSSPVSGAQVLAIAGQPRAIVASATTDAQGRYRLETAEPRFELTVEALGYFVTLAGDIEAESIARACPDSGDCGQTDFALTRAAVFDGWITDRYGNPVQTIELTLEPSEDRGGGPGSRPLMMWGQERNRNRRGASDDRGYFRFWGLRPGTYKLTSRRGGTRYMGMPDPPQLDRIVEIPAGDDSVRMDFQLTGAHQTFLLSGEIEGLEEDDARWMTLEPNGAGERQLIQVSKGKFSSPVPAGEYVARLEKVINADPAASQVDYLATLTVSGDLTDLRLRPQPPTGIRARVVFVDPPPIPFVLSVRLKDRPESQPRRIQLSEADAEIERYGLLPGDYISWVQARSYYLIEQPQFTVVPGQITDVEFQLSNQRSTVRGTARFAADAGKTEAANITVGIRSRTARSVQTDNEGRFVFERLIPGDYEIAAWNRPVVDTQGEDAWREAGILVKKIKVEPGFEVEVDLTITP